MRGFPDVSDGDEHGGERSTQGQCAVAIVETSVLPGKNNWNVLGYIRVAMIHIHGLMP